MPCRVVTLTATFWPKSVDLSMLMDSESATAPASDGIEASTRTEPAFKATFTRFGKIPWPASAAMVPFIVLSNAARSCGSFASRW